MSDTELLHDVASKLDRLIGSIKGNGGMGLAEQTKNNTEAMQAVQLRMEHVQTHESCAANIKACTEARKEQVVEAVEIALTKHKRSKWLLAKDILLGLLSSSVLAALIAGLIELAKMRPHP